MLPNGRLSLKSKGSQEPYDLNEMDGSFLGVRHMTDSNPSWLSVPPAPTHEGLD